MQLAKVIQNLEPNVYNLKARASTVSCVSHDSLATLFLDTLHACLALHMLSRQAMAPVTLLELPWLSFETTVGYES